MLPPDDALAVLIVCSIASGEPSPGTWLVRLRRGARGAGGNGWRANANRCGTTLSASWDAMMSRAGVIDCFHKDSFPTPPPRCPHMGSPVVATRRRRRRGGAIPTTFLAPEEARGVTAVANAVAFFAMMDAFVRWQGGCFVNNGGGDVLVLTTCKSRQWTA